MLRPTALLLLLLANGIQGDSPRPTTPGSAAELAGLWQARHRFGPDIRGPLILQQGAGSWIADVAGYRVPAHWKGDTVTFELPDGVGAFRGHRTPTRLIEGHWIQPPTVNSGVRFASPVTLTAGGGAGTPGGIAGKPILWRGQVVPLDDEFTFYLKIEPRPDGTVGAFLRNPERNLGRFIRVDRIERQGETVRLLSGAQPDTAGEVEATGSYHADDTTLTIAFPGRGGSYDFRRVSPDSMSDFYPRGRPSVPYHYSRPLAIGDGWPTATPEQAGLSRDTLERFIQAIIDTPMDSVGAPEIHGVLLARHGRLVLEEYFHGAHRDQPHDTRSAAKSLTSVLIGAAIHSGVPLAPSSPVYRVMNGGTFPAGLEPRKRGLALEHLLTMSSGLDCDDGNDESPGNENTMQSQTWQPDWYRFILDLKNIRDPGDSAVYCSINPHLAGGVLARAAGRPLPALFHDLVAQPLAIRRYYFFLTPAGDAYMGGGARFLPRDFMKLGQLMLNRGTWNGRRVLSRDWVRRSVQPRHRMGKSEYGYLWWITDYPYRNGTVRAYFASGNGGQYVIVVPKLDLVVAFFGGNYRDAVALTSQREYVPRYLLPAITR